MPAGSVPKYQPPVGVESNTIDPPYGPKSVAFEPEVLLCPREATVSFQSLLPDELNPPGPPTPSALMFRAPTKTISVSLGMARLEKLTSLPVDGLVTVAVHMLSS